MKGSFIFGSLIAVLGIIISVLTRNLKTSFVISGTVTIIAVIICSMLKNFSLIQKVRRMGKGKRGKSAKEQGSDYWFRIFAVFALPNILITLILYIILF